VISDPVAGLDQVFGPEVQVAAGVADLVRLVGHPADGGDPPFTGFPDQQTREEAALRVRTEHSFRARAARLLEVAQHEVAQHEVAQLEVAQSVLRETAGPPTQTPVSAGSSTVAPPSEAALAPADTLPANLERGGQTEGSLR
jgi:hypothetical protein